MTRHMCSCHTNDMYNNYFLLTHPNNAAVFIQVFHYRLMEGYGTLNYFLLLIFKIITNTSMRQGAAKQKILFLPPLKTLVTLSFHACLIVTKGRLTM